MDTISAVHTAQELYEALSKIPQAQRERLPIELYDEASNVMVTDNIHIHAFEVTETEGCIERAFRLYRPE